LLAVAVFYLFVYVRRAYGEGPETPNGESAEALNAPQNV
jgi:hypothetical protein